MSVKEAFVGASLLMKAAFITIIVANLFNWISFTTTSWVTLPANLGGWGLWKMCTGNLNGCENIDGIHSDWYGAVQAFAIFGFLGINIVMLLLILFVFVSKFKGNVEVRLAAVITSFVTAACYLISVIIFGAKTNDLLISLGFSFGLAIASFVLEALTGVLLLLDRNGGGTSPA